jgi:hypothetical protein
MNYERLVVAPIGLAVLVFVLVCVCVRQKEMGSSRTHQRFDISSSTIQRLDVIERLCRPLHGLQASPRDKTYVGVSVPLLQDVSTL